MITVSFNGEIYVYKGLSTDEKPLENVEKSSLFVETDTLRAFKFDKMWKEVTSQAMSQVQKEVLNSALDEKVEAVEGEGLSENNFTDEYKEKLDNALTEVKVEDVDSESATSGQVLTADGEGGASWQNASGGSDVEANPTVPSGTTPTDLTGLRIDDDYYAVSGGGSQVVPLFTEINIDEVGSSVDSGVNTFKIINNEAYDSSYDSLGSLIKLLIGDKLKFKKSGELTYDISQVILDIPFEHPISVKHDMIGEGTGEVTFHSQWNISSLISFSIGGNYRITDSGENGYLGGHIYLGRDSQGGNISNEYEERMFTIDNSSLVEGETYTLNDFSLNTAIYTEFLSLIDTYLTSVPYLVGYANVIYKSPNSYNHYVTERIPLTSTMIDNIRRLYKLEVYNPYIEQGGGS